MSEYRYEGFGFRFTGLTAELKNRLIAALPDFEIESRDPDVAFVIIEKDQDLQPLYFFLEQENIEPAECGVWISFTTTKELDHLVLPQDIIELIRRTKGGVEFSIIALSPDEHEGTEDNEADDKNNGLE
jgi:hypothetical protein